MNWISCSDSLPNNSIDNVLLITESNFLDLVIPIISTGNYWNEGFLSDDGLFYKVNEVKYWCKIELPKEYDEHC